MTGDVEAFDWTLMMRFGLGALGLAPRDFWAMTPVEFDAAVKGRLGTLHDGSPMTSQDLETLASRFPDKGPQ